MTNDRPEEQTSAVDGAGEETDFHHSNAGKNKKKSLKGALILWIIVNDTKQDILSALRGLGHDLFSLLSSFLRIWRNLFDVLRR